MSADAVARAIPMIVVAVAWASAAAAGPTPAATPSRQVVHPAKPAAARTSKTSGESACTRRLPATGQTTALAAGDDGSVMAGAPLSYVDNGDGTVTDRATGLMWEKKVKLDRIRDAANLHDADNCYAWRGMCTTSEAFCGTDADCGANGACAVADCQTKAPEGMTIFKWVAQLNVAKFAGHNDWRIPNAKELQSIVDYAAVTPAVAPAFQSASCATCGDVADMTCSCTQLNNYWSSTTLAQGADGAWVVYFGNGTMGVNMKNSTLFVRAVRGGL